MQEPPKTLFNRNFMVQWQGQTVSRLGSQVFSIAMVFWIKHATGSATIMGLLSLISGLPAVLLMPIGGTFADRFSRRSIIIIGDLLRGIAVCALAAMLYLAPDAVGPILVALFVVSVFNGLVGSFFGPAISATIPDLVPANRVTAANSLGQLSMQASAFLGGGLGGVLYRLLGAPLLFLLNGLSFLYSSGSELFVKIPQVLPETQGDARAQMKAFWNDLVAGMRYVWVMPGLRELVLLSAILSFFSAPIIILLVFYVEDFLKAAPDWYGYIMAGFGVGTVVGYVLAGILRVPSKTRAAVLIAFTLADSLGYSLLGLMRQPLLALILAGLGGLTSGYVTVNITTLIQVTTPSEIRGRVVGLLAALSSSLTPIAMGLAGVIADLLHQNIPAIYIGCGAIMTAATLWLSTSRGFRSILAFEFALPAAEQGTGAGPSAR